jgi:GNAT superfamily N-acetyltransferase
MNAIIRVATETDAEAACQVLRRSITECCVEDHHNDPSLLADWLRNKTPDNVRKWLRADRCYGVVAETDGSLVGFAMLLHSGEVFLCYLVPEARFTGVGRALLAAMEAEARRRGIRELYLDSTKTARGFYLRNGFLTSDPPQIAFGIEGYPMRKRLVASSSGDRGTNH